MAASIDPRHTELRHLVAFTYKIVKIAYPLIAVHADFIHQGLSMTPSEIKMEPSHVVERRDYDRSQAIAKKAARNIARKAEQGNDNLVINEAVSEAPAAHSKSTV